MNFSIRPHFDLPKRELIVSKFDEEYADGYDVEVKKIRGNGVLTVFFDSQTDKQYLQRLRTAMSYFYEDQETQVPYRKKYEDLVVGEICMARMKRPSSVVRDCRLTGAKAYEHHRVRVAAIIDKDKDDIWVQVNFLDSTRRPISLPIEHVYHINPQFLHDPAYVMKCQLAEVEDLEGTDAVERIMRKRPPPARLTVTMFVKTIPTESEDDDEELPAVQVMKKIDSKMFDMKEYVLSNLEVLGPLAELKSNEINWCRIGDADTEGHVWLCPIYHLRWAMETMEKLSKKLYAGAERENLVESCVRIYAKLEKSENLDKVYLAVRDPNVNHSGVVEFTEFNRAQILSIDLDDMKITVRHIDTGERAIYSPQDLYQISEDNRILGCFPPLALKMRLKFICSLVEDGVDYLMKTVRDKNVTVQISKDQTRQCNNVLDVKVRINPNTREEANLSRHLVSVIKCGRAFMYDHASKTSIELF